MAGPLSRSADGASDRARVSRRPPAASYIRAGVSWTLVREGISQGGREGPAQELLGRGGAPGTTEDFEEFRSR